MVRRVSHFVLAAIAAAVIGASAPAHAVSLSELMSGGARVLEPGEYSIRGRNLRCGNAQTLLTAKFWDYGGSLPDLIILNPQKMRTLPWRTRLFVYYHECAHQTVGSDEVAADCRAIRRGKREGWLRPADVETICTGLFIHSRGDYYHPPGRERCEYLRQCFGGVVPARRTAPGRMLDTLNTK